MKTHVLPFFVFGILLFSSCEKSNVSEFKEVNSLTKSDQKYNNTEIAAIEKASGVKYYKTEKIVKDKSGKNSVTFLYGGPDKEMLDEYLANLELGGPPTLVQNVPSKHNNL